MPQPLRQSQTQPDADNWLSLDRVCELTDVPERTWRWRAADEAKTASQAGRKSRAMKDGKAGWLVHRSIDPRLARVPDRKAREEAARQALCAKHPNHLVERALQKHQWLERWKRECERCQDSRRDVAARIVAEAVEHKGDGFKISVSSLFAWSKAFDAGGLEALVNRYNGPRPAEAEEGDTNRSLEAVEWFYSLFRTLNKLNAKRCHEATLDEAQRAGWAWPASYSATAAWLNRHDDRSLTFLLREGQDRWARKYLPHLRMDWGAIEPGYAYLADHTQLDLWALYKGKPIRPWLTAVIDGRSRSIVGWHVGPTPHQDAIIAALRMAFRDWAVPTVLHIDNGKDFASKAITGHTKQERAQLRALHGAEWAEIEARDAERVECTDIKWRGIAGELGIETHFAIPYSPWSKGIVERWFRTLEDNVAKRSATYCGNNTTNRPECVEQILREHPEDVPDLDAVRQRVGEWIDIYHRTPHRGQGMNGATPLNAWNTAASLRRAVGDELAFLMDVRGFYKVSGNGVSVKVGGATVHYGGRCAALRQHVGREVLIAIDPDSIDRCWAFTPDRERRRLIAALPSNQFIEPYTNADDARESIAETMRDRKGMRKARASAAKRTLTAVQRMNQHSRAKRAELLATGTDNAVSVANIVPVRTGFEGGSRGSEPASAPRVGVNWVEKLKEAAARIPDARDIRRSQAICDAVSKDGSNPLQADFEDVSDMLSGRNYEEEDDYEPVLDFSDMFSPDAANRIDEPDAGELADFL